MVDPRYSTTLAREVQRAFTHGWAFGVLCGMLAGSVLMLAWLREWI